MESKMIINRIWAMPNKNTFRIKPIKELLQKYVTTPDNWFDPFSGNNSPATVTNDLNPLCDAVFHLDALDFVNVLDDNLFDGVLHDPPYSLRQLKECYNNIDRTMTFDESKDASFSKVKNACTSKIKSNGFAISCGWSTNGFGKTRGFEIVEILLVPHGGHHNDTIVVVEKKRGFDGS